MEPISDPAGRHLNTDGINCCGVPPEWKSFVYHFGYCILNNCSLENIREDFEKIFNVRCVDAYGVNTYGTAFRSKKRHMTLFQLMKLKWNDIKFMTNNYYISPAGVANGYVLYKTKKQEGDRKGVRQSMEGSSTKEI